MTKRHTLLAATAIALVLSLQIFGCQLATPSPTSLSPTKTPTLTSTPTPEPTFTPSPTLAPTPISLLNTEEPYLVTGEIPYTSPFFIWGIKDAFVLLEDQAGFVNRDMEFTFPLSSQVLGPIKVNRDDTVTYNLLLPAVPQGTYVDVDNDSVEDTGIQIFAIAYWPNIWGDTFLEERDGTGWSSAYASTTTDPDREYEITGGILIVWAPDNQQEFPTGFGDDELLFTEDDPVAPIPAGYSIVNLDEEPFVIHKEAQPKIDLLEGDSAIADYSDMDYEEAFDALLEQMSQEYAFTEEKGLDWDNLYDEFAPRAARARDEDDFYVVIRDFAREIPDGHISVSGGPMLRRFYAECSGGFGLVLAELSDGRVLVTQVLPDLPGERANIQVGAEIVRWNGTPVGEAIEDVIPYFGSFSTEHTRRLDQVLFLTHVPPGEEVSVAFRNPGAGLTEVTMVAESDIESLIAGWPSNDELALPIQGEILDESGLGYIKITTFAGDYKLMTDLWTHYMEEIIDLGVPGLIIDLRVNGGGSGNLANDFASYFFSSEFALSYWWEYSASTGTFERQEIPERIEPAPLYYRGPVVLLVGPDCVSACEGFAYAMTQKGRAQVVGHFPTAGAYGGVGRGQVTMPEDIALQFPTTRSTTPDGDVIIEGVGIEPDIVVPVTEESALGLEDAVLNTAIDLLLE
ncbi:MAG: S41 family peptidase [Anaerolineae bacterium]